MNLSGYLLDPAEKDWVALLSEWSGALPPVFSAGGACAMHRVADGLDQVAEEIDAGDKV